MQIITLKTQKYINKTVYNTSPKGWIIPAYAKNSKPSWIYSKIAWEGLMALKYTPIIFPTHKKLKSG